MASVYDVQQLRAPTGQRSAAEQASEPSRFLKASMSIDDPNNVSLMDTPDWNTAAFHAAPGLPHTDGAASLPFSPYSAAGVDPLWGSKMNPMESLFSSSPLTAAPYFSYSSVRMSALVGKPFPSASSCPESGSGSNTTASLLSQLKKGGGASVSSSLDSGCSNSGSPSPTVTGSGSSGTHHPQPYPTAKPRLNRSTSTSSSASQPRPVKKEAGVASASSAPGVAPGGPNDPQNVVAKSPEIVKFLEENYERADESSSIPRCDLYTHYQQHCRETGQMVTCQASFGKVIRQLFPWLKARRLGTRGKSKYHYCGIRLVRPEVPMDRLYAAQQAMSQQRLAQQRLMMCTGHSHTMHSASLDSTASALSMGEHSGCSTPPVSMRSGFLGGSPAANPAPRAPPPLSFHGFGGDQLRQPFCGIGLAPPSPTTTAHMFQQQLSHAQSLMQQEQRMQHLHLAHHHHHHHGGTDSPAPPPSAENAITCDSQHESDAVGSPPHDDSDIMKGMPLAGLPMQPYLHGQGFVFSPAPNPADDMHMEEMFNMLQHE